MAYATSSDYTDYTGGTAPTNIDLLLTRASRLVDQALIAAVYDTEDTDVQTALQEATCEQVAAWAAVGEDGTGATAEYADVQIGSVRLARSSRGNQTGAGGGGSAATRLAPQAFAVLQQAGLTGHEPRTYIPCTAADDA